MLFKSVDAALKKPEFPAQNEVVNCIAAAVGTRARWCEGCYCHDSVRQETSRGSAKRRRTDCEHCDRQGRRADEMAAYKAREMTDTSDIVQTPAVTKLVDELNGSHPQLANKVSPALYY